MDFYKREIDYLRISITDRCNLRCYYCMPAEGVEFIEHQQILRYEEITEIVKVAVRLGIKKIRLTGGEPLVRPEAAKLVKMIKDIAGIEEISLTTNGILLEKYADKLKSAGLDRVNISLDTLQADKYKEITGFDKYQEVIAGINAAVKVGLNPVKINIVLMKGVNDDEIFDFINLSKCKALDVRLIEFMPAGNNASKAYDRYLGIDEVKKLIFSKYALLPVSVEKGNGPAEYYKIAGGKGRIGFIAPISNHFCTDCNRLRLTASGKLRPCLAKEQEFDLKSILRKEKSTLNMEDVFLQAIKAKPRGHQMYQEECFSKNMSQIGG